MSSSDQRRVEILHRHCAGRVTTDEAARLLGITPRHMRRVAARFKEEGMSSVVHANRGRAPKHKIGETIRERVLDLAGPQGLYHDLNVCHMTELLDEQHGIRIGRSTLDRLLKEARIRKPEREHRRTRRSRRERFSQEGAMLQIDGSLHDWLEGRGPKMCLLGAIDDATNKPVYLGFRPTEDQAGYLMMLRAITREYGLPQSVYHDKHTILVSPKAPTLDEELSGKEPRSEVGRLFEELGIESIKAHSPQAKGRIERLWGTLQDRLIKEMRLASVSTLEEANAFLTHFTRRFIRRFAIEPREQPSVWIKPETPLDEAYYFAARVERTVQNDHTVSFRGKTFQIIRERKDPSLAGTRIGIHRTPEGEFKLYSKKQSIPWEPASVPQIQPAPKQTVRKAPPPPDPAGIARRKAWLELDRAEHYPPALLQDEGRTRRVRTVVLEERGTDAG